MVMMKWKRSSSLLKKLKDPEFLETLPLKILQAIILIREDYGKKDLTTKIVAKKLKITEGHLCNLIHDFLEMNCTDLIHIIRIENSKPLLRNRKLLIKEVAKAVGFDNPDYFCRVFKKLEGRTPTAFRRR
jgi:YesN/AraC family two-component response regulator